MFSMACSTTSPILRIEEHYTDTAGFTDHVFALCHLLGFRFAPRIRDLADKRLYVPGKPDRWSTLDPLIGGSINTKLIERQFGDVIRLAASIQQGTVTASLILRKLGSYPRQNSLALALREVGRIERTLFMLEWLRDPALRPRVTAGLNKGEAHNALARAVCFNRLGEIRDRSFENQRHRASGLNLLVAAITLWNTVYLERAAELLASQECLIRPCFGTSLRSAGNTSTSPAITLGTQIRGWLKVVSDPSEYPETASARLSVHKFPFREVSPTWRDPPLQ